MVIQKMGLQQNIVDIEGSVVRGHNLTTNIDWQIAYGMYDFPFIGTISRNYFVRVKCNSAKRYAWNEDCNGVYLYVYDIPDSIPAEFKEANRVFMGGAEKRSALIKDMISPERINITGDEKLLVMYENSKLTIVELRQLVEKLKISLPNPLSQIVFHPKQSDNLIAISDAGEVHNIT